MINMQLLHCGELNTCKYTYIQTRSFNIIYCLLCTNIWTNK